MLTKYLLYLSLIYNDLIFHFLNSDLVIFFVEAGLFLKPVLVICTNGEVSISKSCSDLINNEANERRVSIFYFYFSGIRISFFS
jgi:hypothetical protein